MNIDKTSAQDLYIFDQKDTRSVFSLLDFTRTSRGKAWLTFFFKNPFSDIQSILVTQQIIKKIQSLLKLWPSRITNGTVMVIETFCQTDFATIPSNANWFSAFFYKYYHKFQFGLIRYSITHYTIFLHEISTIKKILSEGTVPDEIAALIQKIDELMINRKVFHDILKYDALKRMSDKQCLIFAYYLRASIQDTMKLLDLFARLDAYHSLAYACNKYNYAFPDFIDQSLPQLQINKLLNPLVDHPKPVDINIHQGSNLLFLTGANMAGKSTLIRSVGIAAYLAHLGMGVPAQSMTLTVFDGIHSNIQIADNLFKGESFYYNEVQRIKLTIEKINTGNKWLILIDELFKGTNVHDAKICSLAVLQGLSRLTNTCSIISTHLYELASSLQSHKNIQFKYFETIVDHDAFSFTYNIREGVSNDKIGYLILKHEGIVTLLNGL